MIKKANYVVKGMTRDLAASKFNSDYAYELKNMRLAATESETGFALTNERGTKQVDIQLLGTPIGQNSINDNLIIFTAGLDDDATIPEKTGSADFSDMEPFSISDILSPFEDRIEKFTIDSDNELVKTTLYEGNLNFSTDNPIESISVYENDNVTKVYWTDNKNQPREINITADSTQKSKWNDDSFNFIRALKLNEEVTITRSAVNNGVFAPGVIQYCFTYYNLYESETNIVYTSPLYYISYDSRGAAADDSVNNSFVISLKNLDTNFEYVRLYSIQRTSINATPIVKRVVDLPITITTEGTVTKATADYTDSGTTGESIDATELLYIGGESILAGTITQKDNTLFLGDISLNKKRLSSALISELKGKLPTFSADKTIDFPEASGYYPYSNQLNKNSELIKTFKYLETYRFGVQFQHETGKWSEPIWLGDVRNTVGYPTLSDEDSTKVNLVRATAEIAANTTAFENLRDSGYRKIRPVIVYPTINDREVICQGVLCPTVYNVDDRYSNAPFVQSSWFTRPNAPFDYATAKGYYLCKVVSSSLVGSSSWGEGDTCEVTNTGNYSAGFFKVEKIYSNGTVLLDKLKSTNENLLIDFPLSGYLRFWITTTTHDDFSFGAGETAGYDGDWTDLDDSTKFSTNSKWGALCNSPYSSVYDKTGSSSTPTNVDTSNLGKWAEFRHNYPIPSNTEYNSEIQCVYCPPDNAYTTTPEDEGDTADWVSKNAEYYYIDQSILTFHSPEIEFNSEVQSLDTTGLKLRIVGMVPLHSSYSDISIETSTPVNNFAGDSSSFPVGFYKEKISSKCLSIHGWKTLLSGCFWIDELSGSTEDNTNNWSSGFVVYPWERSGSLNNTKAADSDTGVRSAKLSRKVSSTIRFSAISTYFSSSNIWNAYETSSATKTGISGVSVFNSDEVSLVKIPAPANSGLDDISYYGNIDKVLSTSRIGNYTDDSKTAKSSGYPIVMTGVREAKSSPHVLFRGEYKSLTTTYTDQVTGTDPVSIRYKSTPHAVLALNYTTANAQRVLPTIQEVSGSKTISINSVNGNLPTDSSKNQEYEFWDRDKKTTAISQDVIGVTSNYGFLWLAELYNDNVANRFGGTTEAAFENNIWVPCGSSISLYYEDGTPKKTLNVVWDEGDTFYQRYDCLKTYAFSDDDPNSIVDIVSFMCETHVNLDGRYDRNRGKLSNLTTSPTNFNLINSVYSQENNYFNYRGVDTSKPEVSTYPNIVTWTKTKTNGEETDSWANITLASTLDLDGDKGKIRALKRFNNTLYAFQDKGISNIQYNDAVQIASTTGVPIEIANSGKVNGKRYLSEKAGCVNKWSICETPNGIYFVDSNTKDFYLLNGNGLDNLSDKLGFHSWMVNNIDGINIWDPSNFADCVSYYDKQNNEVLLITSDQCLSYNEYLGKFSSFYSYEHTPYFGYINDVGIMFNTAQDHDEFSNPYYPWLFRQGDYNTYFNEYQPFSVTIVANPEPTSDKIFNNIEFRADSWSGDTLQNTTFDTIHAWNEYQDTRDVALSNTIDQVSNLKKKFRIWRAQIPRSKKLTNNTWVSTRDRIRNPWAYITLSMEKENTDKTVLHDLSVDYFI